MIEIITYLRGMLLMRIVTSFLTLLILFADSGQMIYAHTCFKSNQTSISLFNADDCCVKEKSKRSCCIKKASEETKSCTLGNMSCCSVSAKYVKQSFPTEEVQQTISAVVKEAVTELNLFSGYLLQPITKVFLHSSIPLLRCKDDIRFTQVFRI